MNSKAFQESLHTPTSPPASLAVSHSLSLFLSLLLGQQFGSYEWLASVGLS